MEQIGDQTGEMMAAGEYPKVLRDGPDPNALRELGGVRRRQARPQGRRGIAILGEPGSQKCHLLGIRTSSCANSHQDL